jgi:uncharacterized protein (TIGR03435 family)
MMLRWLCLPAGLGLIYGQDRPARLTFEVASIKPSKQGERDGLMIKAMPGGQRYTAHNVSLKLIISLMYKVPTEQILGGPDWLDHERYDVEAKADRSYSLDDLHIMFQNLLADEFKLTFHKETRQGPVYALMVDKGGIKMAVNNSEEEFAVPVMPAGNFKFAGNRVPISPYFCWWLTRFLDRPVIDKTGLDKFYDFTLEFGPEPQPGLEVPPEFAHLPSIFIALKEQLGLKLEAQKGPVDYYVIDHAEKPATN